MCELGTIHMNRCSKIAYIITTWLVVRRHHVCHRRFINIFYNLNRRGMSTVRDLKVWWSLLFFTCPARRITNKINQKWFFFLSVSQNIYTILTISCADILIKNKKFTDFSWSFWIACNTNLCWNWECFRLLIIFPEIKHNLVTQGVLLWDNKHFPSKVLMKNALYLPGMFSHEKHNLLRTFFTRNKWFKNLANSLSHTCSELFHFMTILFLLWHKIGHI